MFTFVDQSALRLAGVIIAFITATVAGMSCNGLPESAFIYISTKEVRVSLYTPAY